MYVIQQLFGPAASLVNGGFILAVWCSKYCCRPPTCIDALHSWAGVMTMRCRELW